MAIKAKAKYLNISPRKLRLVADQVRGLTVAQALESLEFMPQKGAALVRKVVHSAMSNAEHNNGADIDELIISEIYVDEGPTYKRIRPRAKGRANRIFKRTSHVTVAVDTVEGV